MHLPVFLNIIMFNCAPFDLRLFKERQFYSECIIQLKHCFTISEKLQETLLRELKKMDSKHLCLQLMLPFLASDMQTSETGLVYLHT